LRWGSGNSDDNRPRWAFKIVCRAALKEVFEKSYGTNEVKSLVSFIKKLGFLKVPKEKGAWGHPKFSRENPDLAEKIRKL
jgi:hypothetical protein